MKIAFYKAFCKNSTILDNLVGIFSMGPYSHVELVFSSGLSFSISPRENSARFKYIDFNPDHWEIIDIRVTDTQEEYLMDLARLCEGKKYDYIGALASITPVCIQKTNKVFCSELCVNLLNKAGIHRLNDGCRYSPSKYANEIRKMVQLSN